MKLLNDDGATRTWYYKDGRQIKIGYSSDLAPSREFVTAQRNDSERWNRQKKEPMMHAAHIPATKQMALFAKYGLRAWKKEDLKPILKVLKNDPDFTGCIVEKRAFTRTPDFAIGARKEGALWRVG